MIRTSGLESMLGNLNRQVEGIKKRSEAGLLAGGLIIIGESKKPENCPIEFGNLRNSAYVRKSPDKELLVEFGFHAAYALFVHENLEANHPRNGRAKFLEIPMAEKKAEVREVIRKTAAIK